MEVDNSDDDEDLLNYAVGESWVQLGTVVPLEGSQDRVLFQNIDWHDWDGGKAGGWPVRRTPTLPDCQTAHSDKIADVFRTRYLLFSAPSMGELDPHGRYAFAVA